MTYVVIREGSNPPPPVYTESRFSANVVAGVLTANEIPPIRKWVVYAEDRHDG
jgi:hypothetical protein